MARDLSLRGIARRYIGIPGNVPISLRGVYFRGSPGAISLRSLAEARARSELGGPHWECVYYLNVAYRQTWSHLLVRLHLNPDDGISAADLTAARNRWKSTIEATWSNRRRIGRTGEISCPLTFEVQWVADSGHQTVNVLPGTGLANTAHWHIDDSGWAAAHEFGHYLGHPDEYHEDICPFRANVGSGTIMDAAGSTVIPDRLLQQFANELESNLVS